MPAAFAKALRKWMRNVPELNDSGDWPLITMFREVISVSGQFHCGTSCVRVTILHPVVVAEAVN
jgi:hypothetical protein